MTSLLARQRLVPSSASCSRLLPTPAARPAAGLHFSRDACSSSGLLLPSVPSNFYRRPASQVCLAGPSASVDTLSEVGQNTFWPAVRGAGDKLVVAYFFGDKCVQCKAMYPQLVDMAQELAPQKVLFVKFNCKKENKDLGVELGIKRSPTFQLYHKGKKTGEMIGAKPDELRMLIENTKERMA